jgi:hypothetical protein
MKNISNFLLILLLSCLAGSSYSSDGKHDKIINKYRAEINDSAPDDWYTLASSAAACMKKNIVNKEVSAWIDRSIEIKKTPYNLELKGDYYMKNRLPEKAGEFYLEAIRIGLEEDKDFDAAKLQSKIAKIVNLKT